MRSYIFQWIGQISQFWRVLTIWGTFNNFDQILRFRQYLTLLTRFNSSTSLARLHLAFTVWEGRFSNHPCDWIRAFSVWHSRFLLCFYIHFVLIFRGSAACMLLNAEWVLICLHMGSSGCGKTCSYFLFINLPFFYQSFFIWIKFLLYLPVIFLNILIYYLFVCFVLLFVCLLAGLFVGWLVGPILLLLCFILSVVWRWGD